jgi:eukaryotic-like serine/threonine-protein kinase
MGNQDLDELYPRKFGKYHLLGPLAQGGMGALYLAVTGDRGLERLLVIKTILPHLADAEYIARFRDEAKVVIKLSHGNLIPVFDAGQVGGELFLAMDFVEGRDLRAVWNRCAKKQVAFPIDVAVYLVKELCRGLAYAHSFPDLELVHRDVSPPNVLVSYTGEVKLTDFGLASSTLKLEKTAPGIIYGKVAYMSPEQARGERLDGRSDMYAAGIVLWELLTGRQLFPPGKDQPADLVTRAKNPEVMRPSKRAPRVPVELDEICVRALAPERADRYTSCDEMRQGLQSWLAQNAPTMDAGRISTFLAELFVDDVSRERNEREDMMNRLRRRAMTLPPTHELRQIVERSTGISLDSVDFEPAEVPVRTPGSIGRRATDVGRSTNDRRKNPDRRYPGEEMGSHGSAALARAPSHARALSDDDGEHEIDLVDSIVNERYRVVELIGEGGMGKVYLAEHIEIGKRVAIKALHPSYSRMPELVERFRREARAASKIGHPNIVDVTDSGTTDNGSVYFVMEYLEGVELGSVIERDRAIDVARALRIATQICRALSAAHSVGVIHRDLKPENVFLITRDNTSDFVKVLDFGIAKTAEAEAQNKQRLTSPGMAMGTPEYMAPEQAAGRPADARCDVYSLAAILYEMLTGEPPYRGDNFMEILTKKATIDPVPPHELRPELPEAVSRLVLSAMSRNPDLRPATMDAFEYELNKCLSGRGAAVAQALGMTDPNLMATLNPQMSGRTIDDVPVTRPSGPIPMVPAGAPAMAPAMAAIASSMGTLNGQGQMGAMGLSGPAMAGPMGTLSGPMGAMGPMAGHPSGPMGAMGPMAGHPSGPMNGSLSSPEMWHQQRAESLPTAVTMSRGWQPQTSDMMSGRYPTEGRARSRGAGVFGWALLVLLLVGAGAVGYALVREPASGKGVNVPVAAPPVLPPAAKVDPPIAPVKDPGNSGKPESRDPGRVKRPDRSGSGVGARSDRSDGTDKVKALEKAMARAQDQLKSRKWGNAYASYHKILNDYAELLKVPEMQTFLSQIRVRQARALIENGDMNRAKYIARSVDASALPTRQEKSEAELVRTISAEDEDLLRSKASYESLLKSSTARKEALERLKKLNLKLNLDENDGLNPPSQK